MTEIKRSDAVVRGTGTTPASTPSIQMPNLAQIRAYYDQTWLDYRVLWLNRQNRAIHFGYWDEHTRSHHAALLNMNRVLAARIGVQPGQRILDAGCGVGGSAIWLAQTFGVEVVGITPVASQIGRARRYAEAAAVQGQVTFELRDYTATGYSPQSFDVVWAMESVCHASDKRRFLAEARRLLKPGGRLGMAEYMRYRRPESPEGERLLQSWLTGWAIPDLATPDEFTQWATELGFVDCELIDITPNVEPSLRRLHRLATIGWPVSTLTRRLGLRTATQHGNVRGARDQFRALQRGLWFYALFTATAS